MCEVVIGVGHIDEALDEVGALDEAEEHLEKTQKDQIGWGEDEGEEDESNGRERAS